MCRVRRGISLLLAAVTAVLLLAPGAASAATPQPRSPVKPVPMDLLLIPQGSAMAQVVSLYEVPKGWTSSAWQAMRAAERTRTMQALHSHMHPLHVVPFVWRSRSPYWYIVFTYKGRIVASANVSPAGKPTGVWTGRQALAPYTHGHWSWAVVSWMLLLPGCLLFMLPFVDPRRLRRMAHLDALAVLAFLVSCLVLAAAHLYSSVWLAYPPLIYLLVRLLKMGFGSGSGSGRVAPLLSLRTLVVGLPLLLAARIVLSLLGHQEIDVGYESVIGAFRILHHLPLYYNDANHGDTYGPVTYLAYVPFELLFPWTNSLSNLHAADAAAFFFDFGTIVGLVLLGRRLRQGREGTRLGLVLAWAWAACPFTTMNLVVHTNDGLVSMLTVFALVAIASPVVSGGLLGVAAAAKFSPAGLLPLLAAPRERGRKGALVCIVTFLAVVGIAIYSWLPPQGFSYFWQQTLGYQMTRLDVFSLWGLYSSLHPVQVTLEVFAVVLAAAVAFVPRRRTLAQTCALAGAVTVAVELPAQHWFYYYIAWFLPFVLVAVLGASAKAPEAVRQSGEAAEPLAADGSRQPVLAGA